MALNDYILCDRCGCKLIYDSPEIDNRKWLAERFGDAGLVCPDCQSEDARGAARWCFMKTLPRHKVDRIVYSEPDSWDAVIDNMMGEQNG